MDQLDDMQSCATRIRKPAGAEIEYVPERQTFFVGEPVHVVFRIKNNGDKPISFRSGSDYRGTVRPLRFVFRAVDARDKQVGDPHPGEFYMGGEGGVRSLRPGETYESRLLLQTWCEMDTPGEYAVTAGQDIGWDEPVKELSTREWSRSAGGSFKITVVAPSEKEARKVIDAMVPGVRGGRSVWRAKQPFEYICHPAYLGPLRALASDRSRDVREAAINGIASILTPEATLALIALLQYHDPVTVHHAAGALVWRLPDPEGQGYPPWRSPFRFHSSKENHLRTIRLGWKPEFADLVLPRARRMLRSDNREEIQCGAFMVGCLRDVESMKLVLSAIDRYVAKALRHYPQWGEYGWDALFDVLIRSARTLAKMGAASPCVGKIDTIGKMIVWLDAIGQDAGYRPKGWQKEYLHCLGHSNDLVRLLAVRNIPVDLLASARSRLVTLANDGHVAVRRRTFAAARKHKIEALLPVALARLRTETNKNVIGDVCSFCEALADESHIDILIERLVEASVALPAHLVLYGKTTSAGCGYRTDSAWTEAERRRLQSEWREWFKVNGQSWKKLGRLRPDDKRLSPRPTPRDFTIY